MMVSLSFLLLQMQTVTATVIEDKAKDDNYFVCLTPSPKCILNASGIVECVSIIQKYLSVSADK